MARRTRYLTAGIALLFLLTPSAALAADAGSLTVRVEGAADTLLPRTTVPADGPASVHAGNSCPGNSGAAALERATAGDWGGTWNPTFVDWEVTSIKGEAHSFSSAASWGFYVNNAAASLGVCGQQVQTGDSVLFAPTPTDFSPLGILQLDGVPTTTAPGVAFTVTAKRTVTSFDPPDYLAVATTLPLAGATIALPGGGSATTGVDGKATITLTSGGAATLRASKPGDIRSASEPVCVTTGSDGLCGTVKPGGTSGTPPAAVTADSAPALPQIAGLREGQSFKRGKAPRTLSGSVASDASGVKDVLLRLTRKVPARKGAKARCEAYAAASERWVRSTPCGTEGGSFFSIGNKADWSYLLPAALTAGRYVLDIRTVDGAGNVTRGADRGSDPTKPRTRVVFTVG